ncbi:MAG TPA: hypothetical protein VE783_03415, partial [Candidatus Limnocylindrales bacterium]|nr:hypothetical protein [Candidatus Limnocylindrales bacterium]
MLPPSQVLQRVYGHVGDEWSFLNQSGDIGPNHGLIAANNYTVAVNQKVPTNAPRTYPVTGLGNAQAIAAA